MARGFRLARAVKVGDGLLPTNKIAEWNHPFFGCGRVMAYSETIRLVEDAANNCADSFRIADDSETTPPPCRSSSDVGGWLAVNSAFRKLPALNRNTG